MTRTTTTAATPDLEQKIDQMLAAQAEHGALLADILSALQLLQSWRGARDAADVKLLPAIAQAVGDDRVFTAAELWAHSKVDAGLADALLSADIGGAKQLGKVLRRLSRHRGPLELVPSGRDRTGLLWRLQVV